MRASSFPIQISCCYYLSRVKRKPDLCLCENKDADQLCSNCTADQRLYFRYTDSTTPLPVKSEIASFHPSSATVQASLCQTWSETPKTSFLASRLYYFSSSNYCVLHDNSNLRDISVREITNKILLTFMSYFVYILSRGGCRKMSFGPNDCLQTGS